MKILGIKIPQYIIKRYKCLNKLLNISYVISFIYILVNIIQIYKNNLYYDKIL